MKTHEELVEIVKPRRPWWWRWLKRIGKSLLVCAILLACRQAWRHYQVTKNLDETLAELDRAESGWRLEEIEAAREQIPEDENSARVVVAATKLLPKNWPTPAFADLYAHLMPEEQLASDYFARLNHELDQVRPALKEARRLAVMPRGRHHLRYARNPLATLLNDQAEGRRITHLLVLDAMRHDQYRDMTDALVSCRAAFNTGRAIGDEPFAISQLVRTAAIVAACQGVERALAQGEPPLGELMEFRKLLDNEDAFADLLLAARGERAVDQAIFDALESGEVPIGELAGGKPDWNERLFGFIMRDNFRDEHPTMLTLMSRWVAIARMPPLEQAEAESQFDREIRELPKSAILTRLLLPALTKLSESSRRKHAHLRCLSGGLAAERHRRDQGEWPASLEKLCPKYLLTVPHDPFDGQPLRHRRLDDGVVIYSVGHDGIDNGGNLDREHPNQPGADVGCRLWDVAKRRQPPRPKPAAPPAPMPPPPFLP